MNLQKYALVCAPADTVDRGLRQEDLGEVDVVKAKEQHRRYRQALEHFGYTLIEMSPDSRYPDSVFVEDPAVIIRDKLVIARLRRAERRGEETRVAQALEPFFSRVRHIEAPGFLEGGDVLIANDELYIGLSSRTNAEGADQLARIARDCFGYHATIFEIPDHFLHLKGGVTYHERKSGKGIVTVCEEIAHHFFSSGYELVVTPADERFGANCIAEGERILVHAERLQTKKRLEKAGFSAQELSLSEFEKIDGAMTCLSKIFSSS